MQLLVQPIDLFLLPAVYGSFLRFGLQASRQFPQPVQLRRRFLVAEAGILDPKQRRAAENQRARLNRLQPQLPFDRRAQHGHLGIDVSLLAGRRVKRVPGIRANPR